MVLGLNMKCFYVIDHPLTQYIVPSIGVKHGPLGVWLWSPSSDRVCGTRPLEGDQTPRVLNPFCTHWWYFTYLKYTGRYQLMFSAPPDTTQTHYTILYLRTHCPFRIQQDAQCANTEVLSCGSQCSLSSSFTEGYVQYIHFVLFCVERRSDIADN